MLKCTLILFSFFFFLSEFPGTMNPKMHLPRDYHFEMTYHFIKLLTAERCLTPPACGHIVKYT